MTGEIFYYCFSLILVIGILSWLINLILLRTNGKTTFGLSYKPGTPEHKRVVQLASPRIIGISTVIALAFIANLIYDIRRLLNLEDHDFAQALLLYGTVFVVVLSILMIPVGRKQGKIVTELGEARNKK
jgi:hypothetical protein